MEKNTEVYNELMGKLALLTDGIEQLFPNSKAALVYEMNRIEFEKTKKILTNYQKDVDKFTFDISGTNIVFLRGE